MAVRQCITRLFALLAALALALGPSPGAGVGQAPAEGFSVYLPLVRNTASMIYGRVTDDGIGAEGVSLDLRFFNGSSWSTLKSTTTVSGGNYQFKGVPALRAGQEYLVRFLNTSDGSRLGTWQTRHLTSFSASDVADMGSFDIANITLITPDYGYESSLPLQFSWMPRPTTPSDSYKLNLFDIYDYLPKFTSASLGYASSYTLSSLPAGFNNCNPYHWAITVDSQDGGWGGSLLANEVTFYAAPSYSGIYGCVTEAGTPKSGVPLTMLLYNGLTEEKVSAGTVNTNPTGIFSFTNKPATGANEYYLVRFENSVSTSRVSLYETRLLGGYQAGSSVHIGDFDIADIVLGTPNGEIIDLPYDFQWTPRPATATDSYELDLFDASDKDPYTYWSDLKYVDHYTLTMRPYGFSTGVPYRWNVWVYDPFGGCGISRFTHGVTFSAGSPGAALIEAQDVAELQRLERLRQAQIQSGLAGQPHPPILRYPDYEKLGGR